MNAVLLSLGLLVGSLWPQLDSSGQISGQLVNATPGGSTVAGRTVTLATLTESGWQTAHTETTDANGRFTFGSLPRVPGATYLPIAAHDGAWYYPAQPITLSDATEATTEITVYDGTGTDEALRYDRAAILIAGIQPDALMVMEMSGLTNTEPRTVVGREQAAGGRAVSARFPLPVGAVAFQPQRGMIETQIVPISDGVGLAWPVFPGRQELAYSYQLPFNGDRVAIDKVLAYPVGTLSVYVPEGGLELASPLLQAQGSTELGGRRYQLYTATELNRGDRITAQISGLNAVVNGPQPSMTAPLLAATGTTLLLAGLGTAFLYRKRTGVRSSPLATTSDASADERQKLIAEIAALDERFDQRLLPEGAYRETRAALMNRVMTLTPAAASAPTGTSAARSA